MHDPVVSIKDVSFRYGQDLVLEHISFDIPRGDFIGIIGPNGSGKTTLLRLILGFLKPTEGEVSLFGQPADKFRDWSKIGYVPQKAGSSVLKFPLTVEEVVSMAGTKKAAAESLKAVGLYDQRRRLLSELSGGQQQRVYIARALIADPQLLILDEPTVGVDAQSQAQFYALLRRLNQERQLTLVLVSHDIDVVAQEVKNIVCLNCQVVYHGEPKDVAQEVHEKLYGKNVRFVEHHHG
jgi:zinc transport system ATP-binding protein